MRNKHVGFSLIELMVVIAIMAVLAMVAIPNFNRFLAKAKRTEAYMNLHSLYAAQKAYWAENGKYSTILYGPGGIGWKPEGTINYTYGFVGAEGRNNFVGTFNTPSSYLQAGRADAQSFIVVAAGDIDGDGDPDIITINERNEMVIVQDDL